MFTHPSKFNIKNNTSSCWSGPSTVSHICPHCLLTGTKGEGTIARSPKGVRGRSAPPPRTTSSADRTGHTTGGRVWNLLPEACGTQTCPVTMPRQKLRDQNGRG